MNQLFIIIAILAIAGIIWFWIAKSKNPAKPIVNTGGSSSPATGTGVNSPNDNEQQVS